MAIPRSNFAEECVHQGVRFGVHPHYLVGVAQLRSGISDASDGDRIGPFRLTQAEWNANSFDETFDISDFEPGDINDPNMQCCIYALMTLRAQNGCLARLGRLPDAVELYQEQRPNDSVQPPKLLQDALDSKGFDGPRLHHGDWGAPATANDN
jgi:hypothetical protein